MGLFGKSKKEREKEYMNRLDVPLCLKEDFELIIDDVFTIMGVGTVVTGTTSTSAAAVCPSPPWRQARTWRPSPCIRAAAA